jgi:hypothetical protein
LSFWATGYCVSTVGLDEEAINSDFRITKSHQNKGFEVY